MSDPALASDLDISDLAPPPVPEPVAEPEAVAAPEPEAVVEEPAAEPEPEPVAAAPPAKKPSGMLAELIEERAARKAADRELQKYAPVLSRLTPDVQQAILDGRVVVAPPKSNRDEERERLTETATELGILKADGTPDLEQASKVDAYLQKQVSRAVAPLVAQTERVQNMTLSDRALANVEEAVKAAKANGYDEAIVRDEFMKAYHQPNGPAMLVQSEIAMGVWKGALGRLVMEGKLTTAQVKAAVKAASPVPVPADATGRRQSTGASVQLSPTAMRAYKDAEIDPTKTAFATKEFKVDRNGDVELE